MQRLEVVLRSGFDRPRCNLDRGPFPPYAEHNRSQRVSTDRGTGRPAFSATPRAHSR